MKILKRLIPIIGVLLPLSLSATEYHWLTLKMIDNTEVSVASDNLTINYSDGCLNMESEAVDQNFSVSQIVSMRFTSSPAGGTDVTSGGQVEADYYTVSGVKVGRYASADEARRELPSGIYLVKNESKTTKIIF